MKYSVINGQWILQETQNYVHMLLLKIPMKLNPYALSFMNRKHRFYLAQYQCEILFWSIEIETGRWQNKPLEEIICKIYESGELENIFHFIFSCTLSNNIRAKCLQNIGNIIPNIRELNEVSQIKTFMSMNFDCRFAKLICDMFQKRVASLFI